MSGGRIRTGQELTEDLQLSCDVCVIGSGAGGGWLAHELVARGLSVVMLEEGGYLTRRDFKLEELHAFSYLYQELGNRSTDDQAVGILQGRSVGGGTTVNWTTCFRTPAEILALWRERHGVEGLSVEALTPHWEAIERRLHIAEWPLAMLNRNNRILYEALGKLGYHRGLLRRNVNGCANLGYCGLGCPLDAKQSTLVTVIPDAVEKGLDVYANVSVRRIEADGRRASRVFGEVLDPERDRPTGVKVTVRPKAVAVCAGAINSPALLLRSGLDGGGLVGRHTFLHPFLASFGEFDEPVHPFAGAPQGAYSHQFAERGKGKMGFFIESGPMFPMMVGGMTSGLGAPLGDMMSQLPKLAAIGAALIDGVPDGDEGGVVALRSGGYGRVSLRYPITARHSEAIALGASECARLLFAAGARRVFSLNLPMLVLESERELARLERADWSAVRMRLGSAHQMGGCRMGKDPSRSVVDSRLRYHQLDNLFVVDGSVFPSGLGVNPQETIYGLARWGAQHVAQAV